MLNSHLGPRNTPKKGFILESTIETREYYRDYERRRDPKGKYQKTGLSTPKNKVRRLIKGVDSDTVSSSTPFYLSFSFCLQMECKNPGVGVLDSPFKRRESQNPQTYRDDGIMTIMVTS